jgi:O-antigen/teichoic acid export membrane protein
LVIEENEQDSTPILVSIGAVQMLIMLVALVRAKALSLLLGPDGYGIVSTVDQTVISVVQLGGLSVPLVAMKFMARGHSEGQTEFQSAFSTFLRALGILSIASAIIGALVLMIFPAVLGSDLVHLRSYFLLAMIGVPAMMLNILFVNTMAAAQLGAASATLNLSVLAALAVAAVAGVAVAGIEGGYVATALTGMITTIGTLRYLRARLGLSIAAAPRGIFRTIAESPGIVSSTMYLYGALAAYSLTMLLARYFVFDELGAAEAGMFQALLSVSLTLAAAPSAMAALHFAPSVNRRLPTEAKAIAANDFAAKLLLLLALGGVGVALFPRVLLTVLFSGQFDAAASAVFVFVVWQCLLQLSNVYLNLLIGLDDLRVYTLVMAVSYTLVAASLPPLTSDQGLAGAGIALSVGMAVATLAVAVRLRMTFGVSVSRAVTFRAILTLVAITGAGVAFEPATELTLRGAAERMLFFLIMTSLLWLTSSADERRIAGRLALLGRK